MSKKNKDGRIFQKIDPWIADDEDIAAAGPLADCVHTRALLCIRRNLSDGKIPKRCFGEISYGFNVATVQKILKSFLSSGLWIEHDSYWEIRNWAVKYNMSEHDMKERSEELSKSGSLGMHNRWHSQAHPNPDCQHCIKKKWVK